jgi:dihydroorotase
LVGMLEKVDQGILSLPTMVQKMCHNPAILFDIDRRGYLREGYYADLVLVKPNSPWTVSKENIVTLCGWSPFTGTRFSNSIQKTFVNGHLAYDSGVISGHKNAMRLNFNRD